MARVLNVLAVVLGFIAMVPYTMQLSMDHPLHTFVEKLNLKAGPFLGLVVGGGRYEKALLASAYFEADTATPYINIAGRRFNFGKFNGNSVVYVLAGEPSGNVGATVQILIDTFSIKGIISYGSAGTVSNKVFIADVVVPSEVAFTGVWNWPKYESEAAGPALKFGDYNVPEKGANYLEHVEVVDTQKYTPQKSKSAFWFYVHPEWIQLASKLNFGEKPTVHIGGENRVGSSDIYVSNQAYGSFLNTQLNVTAADQSSASIVSTAIANGVPHIVFRGTSNRPGSPSDDRLSEVTANNVLKTVAVFIDNLSPKANTNTY